MTASKKTGLKPGEKSVWLTFTVAEREGLRVLAATHGLPMSEFVRGLVRRELRKASLDTEKKIPEIDDQPY